MSDDRHHSASAKRPAPGSVYDFLLAGQKILDAELMFGATTEDPLLAYLPCRQRWLGPDRCDARSYFHQRAWERALEATLDAIAAPDDVVPLSLPRYIDVVCRLADQFLAETQDAVTFVRHHLNGIPPHVRVLAAAKAITPGQSSTKAADHLNSGSRGVGITRHHVDRAWDRFSKDSSARPEPGSARMLAIAALELDGLQFLLAEALQRSDIRTKRLRGAALAQSLNDTLRLVTFLDRAPFALRDFRELFRASA